MIKKYKTYEEKRFCRDCNQPIFVKDTKKCNVCLFHICRTCNKQNHKHICKNMLYDYRIHSPEDILQDINSLYFQVYCPKCEQYKVKCIVTIHAPSYNALCDTCYGYSKGYRGCRKAKQLQCDYCGMKIVECYCSYTSCEQLRHNCSLIYDYSKFHFRIAHAFPRRQNRSVFCFLMICKKMTPIMPNEIILKIIRLL